jgi:flagellar basal-body rod protein FlgC
MSLSNVFSIAGSAMNAQSVRLNTTASNLANAESISSSTGETYRARKPVFEVRAPEVMQPFVAPGLEAGVGVHVAAVVESGRGTSTGATPAAAGPGATTSSTPPTSWAGT